ncbi:MAG TPA: TadE/TadG family type IV pilus assembly protein [Solirubrobacterales bacterium]|nr:TadE/TadG family type IV pilus assembly protein [Solirubrobacterales bacterium]
MSRRPLASGSIDRRARRRRGMAMVEFVLILPALLVILFGILEFGVLFFQWQTLSNAAREGAREAIVFRKDCDAGTVQTLIEQTVIDYADAANITVAAADISITGPCTGGGQPLRVQVTHDYTFHVLPGFLASFTPTIPLVGTSEMRNEGQS